MSSKLRFSSPLTWLIDPFSPTEESARPDYRPGKGSLLWIVPTMIGIALLAVSAVGWSIDPAQFYFSYLVGWAFCLSIAIGALFFVLIQHLTKARWSVVVRRISESLTWTFPLLALLSIPIFLGMHDLYHWTHEDLYDPADSHYDPILAGKRSYLNTPFFLARIAFYFIVWCSVSYRLYSLSVREDLTGAVDIKAKQRKVSAIGLPLLALTTAFGSYDILMSVDPHWFSTIFGVYFFAASFWTVHALIALIAILLQRSVGLQKIVTAEHYQDLGKMMFGFTVFWAYIAFSQYMLIWYGNLPEETIWYRHRLEHGWEAYSAALLIAHFIIPFWVLVSRGAKRKKAILAVMAVWFLVMNWFDMHWLVMPVHSADHAAIHWLSLSCWLGLFGVVFGSVMYRLRRHSLVPQNDPYLSSSLAFTNS